MLHKHDLKSKGETALLVWGHPLKVKGRLKRLSLPLLELTFGSLVSFLANKRRHIEIVWPCLHHGPR